MKKILILILSLFSIKNDFASSGESVGMPRSVRINCEIVWAANNPTEDVKKLLEHYNIENKGYCGRTPLIEAIVTRQINAVSNLLKLGANINAFDAVTGKYAKDLAKENGFSEMLVEIPTDKINESKEKTESNEDIICEITQLPAVLFKIIIGFVPDLFEPQDLFEAIDSNNYEKVKYFLQSRVDVNAKGGNAGISFRNDVPVVKMWTPIASAVSMSEHYYLKTPEDFNNNLNIIKYLLDQKASTNLNPDNTALPLTMAIDRARVDIVQLLLGKRASTKIISLADLKDIVYDEKSRNEITRTIMVLRSNGFF